MKDGEWVEKPGLLMMRVIGYVSESIDPQLMGLRQLWGKLVGSAGLENSSVVPARLNDLQHKLQGVRYHRENYERHEDGLVRQFEADHAPPTGAELELQEPRLIYEVEGFLLQFKSALDMLPQLLRSLGYRSMGESFGNYGERVINALDNAPRARAPAAQALKEEIQGTQEWLRVVIDFRDEIAHQGVLEGFSCFRQRPYTGGSTAAIHYPEMPTGQRVREYMEQTEDRLRRFVDTFVHIALKPTLKPPKADAPTS